MSALTAEIEHRLAEQADLYIAVEEDGNRLVLSGLIATEDERATALDIVSEAAPNYEIEDNLDVSVGIPEETSIGRLEEGGAGMFPDAEADLEEEDEAIEPGDFTDQPVMQY